MRIPRNIDGEDLVRALKKLGDERVRQEASHIRLTTSVNGVHHVTVPKHRPLKVGTLLHGVLKPVAAHHGMTIEEIVEKLKL